MRPSSTTLDSISVGDDFHGSVGDPPLIVNEQEFGFQANQSSAFVSKAHASLLVRGFQDRSEAIGLLPRPASQSKFQARANSHGVLVFYLASAVTCPGAVNQNEVGSVSRGWRQTATAFSTTNRDPARSRGACARRTQRLSRVALSIRGPSDVAVLLQLPVERRRADSELLGRTCLVPVV